MSAAASLVQADSYVCDCRCVMAMEPLLRLTSPCFAQPALVRGVRSRLRLPPSRQSCTCRGRWRRSTCRGNAAVDGTGNFHTTARSQLWRLLLWGPHKSRHRASGYTCTRLSSSMCCVPWLPCRPDGNGLLSSFSWPARAFTSIYVAAARRTGKCISLRCRWVRC